MSAIVEIILTQLGICYRKIQLTQDTLYFCMMNDTISFDLLIRSDHSVRLWRLITAAPAGIHQCICRLSAHAALGYARSEADELVFYAERTIAARKAESCRQLWRMIKGFCHILDQDRKMWKR